MAEDRSESTLFGEMRRMVRTSGAVGGIAARVAGERFLGIKTDKSAHAEGLKAVLGGLKGPLMKVAQFLATVPEALPEEYAQELATLQSNAPPMGWAFVRRRMQGELGPAWQQRFKTFGQEAAAAASLGQVHRATLPDGREVACKLQYPDMPSVVEADLRQLKMALSLYRRMDSTLDNEEAYAELSARLRHLAVPMVAFLLIYALLVIGFASAYRIADALSVTALFHGSEGAIRLSYSDALYFSVTTLSTVGYGDIRPHDDGIRVLASIQVVAGQLLLLFGFAEIMRSRRIRGPEAHHLDHPGRSGHSPPPNPPP